VNFLPKTTVGQSLASAVIAWSAWLVCPGPSPAHADAIGVAISAPVTAGTVAAGVAGGVLLHEGVQAANGELIGE
jgi:hypothetical protein